MGYMAAPLSRAKIRYFAASMRKFFGVDSKLYVPIVRILEYIPQVVDGANFEIVGAEELDDGEHAVTELTTRTIKIRQDVYDNACKGSGRDRMTIAHEIAHLFLLCVFGVGLARSFCEIERVPAYRNPEWQAKCLAGEFMMGANLVSGMDASDVALECGVSLDAARYCLSKLK